MSTQTGLSWAEYWLERGQPEMAHDFAAYSHAEEWAIQRFQPQRQPKVFYNTSFTGRWPVGTAAVVIAENRATAAVMLQSKLGEHGLDQRVPPAEMFELELKPQAVVLLDGDY